jgi:hypothetical protein
MMIMMQAVWGYVVFVGLRIVGFACGSHVGVERDSRVTDSWVVLRGNTFTLCILMLCTSYLNFVRCSIFLRKRLRDLLLRTYKCWCLGSMCHSFRPLWISVLMSNVEHRLIQSLVIFSILDIRSTGFIFLVIYNSENGAEVLINQALM